MIERTFKDIQKGELNKADQQSYLVALGWGQGTTWDGLLRSKRVLIISEAGAGKTYECREQAKRLWDSGKPAFFLELASLSSTDLRDMLDDEEEKRLDLWLVSQSDVATFFLDSIDELELSRGSFDQALKRLKKGIGSQLGRARIVITTRPIAFDEQVVQDRLPIPPTISTESREESFAKIAMNVHRKQKSSDKDQDEAADWRTVALMPLSEEQIVEFAQYHGVEDPSALLEDLQKRNAWEFARRPQDLIELCVDWNEHKRIRTHQEQVATNVRIKLQPRDRIEPAELSVDKAIEGASRLALAMLMTRRWTIRHSAASDDIEGEAALDSKIILSDWNPNEIKALLERPLFGFASYGRVRFHHRSVTEYLTAERLRTLQNNGMPFRAIKRLLFAETRNEIIVRPSKRPIAGWLALTDNRIFEMLRDNEPAVLLDEGDPESLTQTQRNQALQAYVERYGKGGWRGLSVPHIQIHRFASPELASEINQLWNMGIENPEVKEIVLYLIETGRIFKCADIAFKVACDSKASNSERHIALDALVALQDSRLKNIANSVAAGDKLWLDNHAQVAIISMFPQNLSVKQLCQTLGRLKKKKRSFDDFNWQFSRLIQNTELNLSYLEELRDGLIDLIADGLRWQKEWPHITSNRQYFSNALAATCLRGLDANKSDEWFYASALALRLHHYEYSGDDTHKPLQERLISLNAEENARFFWAMDSLIQSLHTITDPWMRLIEISWHDIRVELHVDRDLGWIKKALSDVVRSIADRAMLLEAAIRLPPIQEQWREYILGLKPLVADQIDLLAVIDARLKPSQQEKQHKRWEKKEAERKIQRERKEAKNLASWIQFWRQVAKHPERAFSTENSFNTAWYLWKAMSNDGENSRESGWNRHLIEEHFGKETAEQLRRILMNIWRQDCPSLASERSEGKCNITLIRWQLGLAALYAEAEDPLWATKVTEEEAKLAARYAPIELNALPSWIENLIDAHPDAVDSVLGKELSYELNGRAYSMLLQCISYAPDSVAKIFLPRLKNWLDNNGDAVNDINDLDDKVKHLDQVLDTLLKYGDEDMYAHILHITYQRLQDNLSDELTIIWLFVLMRINPEVGINVLEEQIQNIEPNKYSKAVSLFATLFGDRHKSINLKGVAFTPKLLLRLLRLAYQHIRIQDDALHDGTYTPDTRDNAEHARNNIVNVLLDAKGEDGWKAKLEMAEDPLCAHFRDRIFAIAQENWAQEIDSDVYNDAQAVALDKSGEAPASTNEAMYNIMCDRLADIDELLQSDTSPRELWATIDQEKLMRREIARVLTDSANGLYRVNQEAVTADEKETDIRLHSVVSNHEAVIELKLADNRTARDLRDTIYNQLVKRYMEPDNRRSGCLLITLAKERIWVHPDNSKKRIKLSGLEALLRDEAKRIENSMGGSIFIAIHILDLRPRMN